jgi:site-specific DNA-adenine methylase
MSLRKHFRAESCDELVADGHARGREAVALFFYLNRTGLNGLCRFNRRGAFNVPFGRASASATGATCRNIVKLSRAGFSCPVMSRR